MRKILFMIMLSLLLFTQCKKDNVETDTEEMVPIRLEVPLDKSRTDFSELFPFGKINWGNGKNIEYVYLVVPYAVEFCDVSMGYYVQHLGVMFEMEAEVHETMDKLVFEGRILPESLNKKDNCMIYYFGNNGNGGTGTNVTTYYKQLADKYIIGKKITFDKQTGSVEDLGNYHLAKALVSVKKNVDEKGKPISYDLAIESFTTINSLALLDLDRVYVLEGTAARMKSFTLKWTEDYVFEEIYEYDPYGYIDVENNVGKRCLISLLPTEKNVSLQCFKGEYEFVDGIKSNWVYTGQGGEALEWNSTEW